MNNKFSDFDHIDNENFDANDFSNSKQNTALDNIKSQVPIKKLFVISEQSVDIIDALNKETKCNGSHIIRAAIEFFNQESTSEQKELFFQKTALIQKKRGRKKKGS